VSFVVLVLNPAGTHSSAGFRLRGSRLATAELPLLEAETTCAATGRRFRDPGAGRTLSYNRAVPRWGVGMA